MHTYKEEYFILKWLFLLLWKCYMFIRYNNHKTAKKKGIILSVNWHILNFK